MKIGLSSDGKELSDSLASNFGRCSYFIVFDSISKEISTAYQNTAKNALGGAGIQAAQSLLDNQVEVVIAPQMGPNAWKVIQGAQIKIYTGIDGSLRQNIDRFLEGDLDEMTTAHGSGIGKGRGRGQGRGN
jgi:predicted Fe-Mo cluster-binding NifX family protein